MSYIEAMMDFIRRSPTAFHAVANLRSMLEEGGFCPLNECAPW